MSPDAKAAIVSVGAIVTTGAVSAVLGATGGKTTGFEAVIIIAVFGICMSVVVALAVAQWKRGNRW